MKTLKFFLEKDRRTKIISIFLLKDLKIVFKNWIWTYPIGLSELLNKTIYLVKKDGLRDLEEITVLKSKIN